MAGLTAQEERALQYFKESVHRFFPRTGIFDALYSDILTGHREKREMADYDPVDFQISREETDVIVRDANEFVRKIEGFCQQN